MGHGRRFDFAADRAESEVGDGGDPVHLGG